MEGRADRSAPTGPGVSAGTTRGKITSLSYRRELRCQRLFVGRKSLDVVVVPDCLDGSGPAVAFSGEAHGCGGPTPGRGFPCGTASECFFTRRFPASSTRTRENRPEMRLDRFALPERILAFVAGALILRVTASIVSGYPGYFPPDFSSGFLRGREGHFWGAYRWAFYTHILSGPVSLVLGLFLVVSGTRARFPSWHRRLGRLQVACILLLVTPSGLWMATRAAAGPISGIGLGALAVATATCAALGARGAIARRFVDHRRWMWRCYLLLCSAVVLRLLGGLATVTGILATWVDPLASWVCWLVPLAVFEWREWWTRRGERAT